MDIQGSEALFIKDIKKYIGNKKILNIIIATHSEKIHQDIIGILKSNSYNVIINQGYGAIGGDGYIYSKI